MEYKPLIITRSNYIFWFEALEITEGMVPDMLLLLNISSLRLVRFPNDNSMLPEKAFNDKSTIFNL
jgi:hypothetical protein